MAAPYAQQTAATFLRLAKEDENSLPFVHYRTG